MIYGVGTDIVQISRIELASQRNGDRFSERILGVEELAIYHDRKAKSDVRGQRFLATRFAAKEAFSKALNLGMRIPMAWHAVQILNALDGQPIMLFNHELSAWMLERALVARVSISDEAEYAVAFVIVEHLSLT